MSEELTKEVFNWNIAWAAQCACILEADAPKVGNVNRYHDFSDCTLEAFHLSALAIMRPFGEIKEQGVGRTIFNAISATTKLVTTNTNLGIVLLFAPLGMAYSKVMSKSELLRSNLDSDSFLDLWKKEIRIVLEGLSVEDAYFVYRAIRLASPSGMGDVEEYDVNKDDFPRLTLLEAMKLSAKRDMIAQQYTNNFEQVINVGYKAIKRSLQAGLHLPQAIAHTQLFLLSQYGDSLIARKLGVELSIEVQKRACEVWENGGFLTPMGQKQTQEFDLWLREDGHKRNPGATADLMAAIIFVLLLENKLVGCRELI
ncbi:MAG: triphosphoribosyl-dephospho-CoA synthase [Eubacteriales bacterium]